MEYSESVVLILSYDGWNELDQQLNSSLLPIEDRRQVAELIKNANVHLISNDDKSHFIFFENIQTFKNKSDLLFDTLLQNILEEDWYFLSLGIDGTEEERGAYYNNSFSPKIFRYVRWSYPAQYTYCDKYEIMLAPTEHNVSSPANTSTNNFTCGHCGNTRCYKQEPACTKCGKYIN
jgi:hypothetical protein